MEVKKITKTFAGKEISILGQVLGDQIWLKIDGATHCIALEDTAASQNRKSKVKEKIVKAPMPGKIIKIHKCNDAEVAEYEPIVAMEAMKMEYVLKAPCAGKVTGLNLTEGQQIELGQKLFEIK